MYSDQGGEGGGTLIDGKGRPGVDVGQVEVVRELRRLKGEERA
jgi:hypothetical protein